MGVIQGFGAELAVAKDVAGMTAFLAMTSLQPVPILTAFRHDAHQPGRLRRTAADFEGEDIESRLARRTRNWIADVRLVDRQNLTTPALRATPPQDEEGK